MENIQFKIHPRVFEALGKDLVTNNVIAIIELVKNSYDAFAQKVSIDIRNEGNKQVIEIIDDGYGMTPEIIRGVWAVIATPYKEENKYASLGNKKRRVAGEKGLGRLSLARLGKNVLITTKTKEFGINEFKLEWESIFTQQEISKCNFQLYDNSDFVLNTETGTRILISDLNDEWEDDEVKELEENLSRLLSPFAKHDDFIISLKGPNDLTGLFLDIESPKFLLEPKYKIKGSVSKTGKNSYEYVFLDKKNLKKRMIKDDYSWEQFYMDLDGKLKEKIDEEKPTIGEFDFEIRAWDIGTNDIEDIAELYDIEKNKIRKAIRFHKGISVYRDDILVLPKTDNNRDWLGLDIRRVSRVGSRLSTSQIVGYVSITAEENPKITDASDREKLVQNQQSIEFQELLISIVKILEVEREKDKKEVPEKNELTDLFEELNTDSIVSDIEDLASEGASAAEAVPLLRDFQKNVNDTKKKIQDRFVYYSRMATVGTIAQMLVHEIRNRTTVLGEFHNIVKKEKDNSNKKLLKYTDLAEDAIKSLDQLAETFAPLASRTYSRRKRFSSLKERIERCLLFYEKDIKRLNIHPEIQVSANVTLAVDPGELDAIIINLINNSIYWLAKNEENRILRFNSKIIKKGKRILISCDDTGPGIKDEDLNKILLPGVTRKPDGIGMGLTVVSELVSEYEGKFSIMKPGNLSGATFIFDLPVKE